VVRHATRRSTPGRFSDVGRERNDPKSRCFHIQNLNDHAGARIDGIQASNSAVGAAVSAATEEKSQAGRLPLQRWDDNGGNNWVCIRLIRG